MDFRLITLITFAIIFLLLASGTWISVALGWAGIILIIFFMGGDLSVLGPLMFNTANSFDLASIPLFIFMGEILLRSGISKRLYRGATPWVGFLPGGLLHTNILACAIFAAISGSSMATAATVGTIAIPELDKRGYNKKLMLGSLAAGGTLGILIPPSIGMIVYGALVMESIGKLFMAGLLPGIIMAGLFMVYIAGTSIIHPELAPERERLSIKELAYSIFDFVPFVLLIFFVLGTIYLGIATPAESAAMGSSVSLILSALYRGLTWRVVKEAALGALKVTCWGMFIMIGAQVITVFLGNLKVTAQLAEWIVTLAVNRYIILGMIIFLYLVLGMFIEALSMVMLTVPVVYPILIALGFDSLWIGVLIVIMIEMAQISPPVGVNLYVIHGLSGEKYLNEIIMGIIPFFVCQVVIVLLIIAFPSIATWLPGKMR